MRFTIRVVSFAMAAALSSMTWHRSAGAAPPDEAKPPATSAQKSAVEEAPQGIRGQVVRLTGNFLPGADPAEGKREPLVAPVHLFRGKVQPFDKPNPKHPALLKIVQPDREGRFALPLPPGEYTLVVVIDGRMYLNNWLEDGSWATTTVEPKRWRNHAIEDVSNAAF